MPDVALNIVRPWAVPTQVIDVGTKEMIESVYLEAADGLAEEASADEEEKVGHDDEEDGEGCVEDIRYGQDSNS